MATNVNIRPLFAPVQLTNAAANYYTAGVITRVDKMVLSNPSAATAYNAIVYWVPSGGSAGTSNIILPRTYLQPLSSLDVVPFIGQTLGIGDSIWAVADTGAQLNFFASGTTVS